MTGETLILNDSLDINILNNNLDLNLSNEKVNIGFSGTGTLSGSYMEVVKLYDDSLYINYQNFTFLLTISLIGILLMITLIKVFQIGFNTGFTLFSNKRNIGLK